MSHGQGDKNEDKKPDLSHGHLLIYRTVKEPSHIYLSYARENKNKIPFDGNKICIALEGETGTSWDDQVIQWIAVCFHILKSVGLPPSKETPEAAKQLYRCMSENAASFRDLAKSAKRANEQATGPWTIAYLVKIIPDVVADRKRQESTQSKETPTDWRKSWDGICEKAKEHGLTQDRDEQEQVFIRRVINHVDGVST